MTLSLSDIQESIPSYLTKEAKDGLLKALQEDFPKKINYYSNSYMDELLQGDGWKGLDIINIETLNKKPILGIILSNSCDISDENKRDVPPYIVFAPLISLDAYANILRKKDIPEHSINAKFTAIREQKVTSMFYLPKFDSTMGESVALLDQVCSIPIDYFTKSTTKSKKFTLSQVGFWLFLFKLSIHFCRFHEKIHRDE